MSPWDRRAEIQRYERMFDITPDEDALIEELGTPTRVAVELARDYVATPPPENLRWQEALDEAARESPRTAEPEPPAPEATEPEPPPAPERARELRGGGVALFVLCLLVFGIPVTVVLAAVGVPFLVAGIGCAGLAAEQVFRSFGRFNLFSDMLLVWGCCMALAGIGLMLAWLGIWLSLSLCRLWLEKVLLPLARALCLKKEVAQDG